jgi:hypothetical protein
MEENKTEDWYVVCRNVKCKHRYPIPPGTPVKWKTQKFRGVCGHGDGKVILELLEPVKCPECGEESYRTVPRYFLSTTNKTCSI